MHSGNLSGTANSGLTAPDVAEQGGRSELSEFRAGPVPLLSILIPVYNERTVVEKSLALVLTAPLPENMERELVIVDDCSTDGTSQILDRLAASEPRIRLFRQTVNQGKGAAVRRAIQEAAGDFCIVQDADLEYDPSEYSKLMRPLLDGRADA